MWSVLHIFISRETALNTRYIRKKDNTLVFTIAHGLHEIFSFSKYVWRLILVHGCGWMKIADRYFFLIFYIALYATLSHHITSFTTYFTTCVYIPWHLKSYVVEKTISSHSQQHCNKITYHFLLMLLFTKFGTAPLLPSSARTTSLLELCFTLTSGTTIFCDHQYHNHHHHLTLPLSNKNLSHPTTTAHSRNLLVEQN